MRLGSHVRALARGQRPVLLGSFGSTQPLSGEWGYDRGTPVDRWYIDRFLRQHRADITGRVLEVKDSGYTDRWGMGVEEADVLDIDSANARATYIADLADGVGLPDEAFDCFVLTQTLHYIFDVPAALRHAVRVLRPGGVLLVTVPMTSRAVEDDYWRFTPLALSRLLAQVFAPEHLSVSGHGNVLASVAFLEGLAAEELTISQLEVDDVRFPLIVCARAVKAA